MSIAKGWAQEAHEKSSLWSSKMIVRKCKLNASSWVCPVMQRLQDAYPKNWVDGPGSLILRRLPGDPSSSLQCHGRTLVYKHLTPNRYFPPQTHEPRKASGKYQLSRDWHFYIRGSMGPASGTFPPSSQDVLLQYLLQSSPPLSKDGMTDHTNNFG